MAKLLTAQQKAQELGITTSGLAKTRHLYKHVKKSPRKYLYFEEEGRPFMPEVPVAPGNSRSRIRRRLVPFGDTNYSKAPSGSGDKLKALNQMRAKMALEASIPKEEQETLTEALAYKVKENYKEINEQRRLQLQQELIRNDEDARKQVLRTRNPIQAEPVRRYPYTNISGYYPGPPSTRWSDEPKKPKKVYKYY